MEKTKITLKKLMIFCLIILLLENSIMAANSNEFIKVNGLDDNDSIEYLIDGEKELDLLHGETIFSIFATDDVNSFNLTYSVPPVYRYQVPIFLNIRNDTTANIVCYRILNDTNPPNKIINFTIGSMNRNDSTFIHFDYWVLVKNNNYLDLPGYVEIPTEDELPEETKTWLIPTEPIQSDNIAIKIKAKQLRGLGNNLLSLSDKIVKYTSNKGNLLFRLFDGKLVMPMYQILLLLFNNRITSSNWYHFNDALCSLFWGGSSCTGRANLGTALFRANGIPTKDLIVMSTGFGKWWYNIHYVSEYYCPDYGWIIAETSVGVTPYYPKYDIVLRVNYPEDENVIGNGFDYYGGCEQWFWLNNQRINGNVLTQSWIENEVITSEDNANEAFQITKTVWEYYIHYAGINLNGENLGHFNNATNFQKDALWCIGQSDVDGYIVNMILAYGEYIEIDFP